MGQSPLVSTVPVLTAQVITATGEEASYRAAPTNGVPVLLQVSAVSGTTPSATFAIQWSNDGINWATPSTPDAFAAITANGNVVQSFPTKAAFWRLAWTVSGTTPSFTVTATSVAQ